jgi:periplasmic divalent cation tolerance protein
LTPVIILTTVGGSFDPAPLARELIGQRLAACVNIVDGLRSIYRWEGKVEEEGETLLLIKTVEEQIDAVRDVVFSRHPYEVPEFVVVAISRIEGPYRNWLIESVSAG